ncbi:MAG: hypothetical protein Q9181_003820 [Wetmoreana brouardii]
MPDKKLYEPLQDRAPIRLFQLRSRKEGSYLQGRLLDSNLADCQAYEAISYVWGSEADKIALDCDGSQVLITQNLAAALRRIRLPEANRVLWIDSICVNQNDVLEKNHQVRLMSQIYRKASSMLIWLGEERERRRRIESLCFMTADDEVYIQIGGLGRCLLSLLKLRRGAGCKDPRDLLYSVLGAAADEMPIEPDYGRSFEYVYATSTAQIISTTGSLNIFNQLYGEIE